MEKERKTGKVSRKAKYKEKKFHGTANVEQK